MTISKAEKEKLRGIFKDAFETACNALGGVSEPVATSSADTDRAGRGAFSTKVLLESKACIEHGFLHPCAEDDTYSGTYDWLIEQLLIRLKMPRPSGRDTRRQHVKQALDRLIARRALIRQGGLIIVATGA